MRGIGAGAVLATIELRLLLLEAGDRLVANSIYCRLTLYVDDATIETVGASSTVVSVHAGSVNRFVADLQKMRLQFSPTKNVLSASTGKLADAALGALVGLEVRASARVTSLGTGLGAGKRRNMLPAHKRYKAFVARRSRFKRLRAARVSTSRLLRTGGNAAMVFGQKPLGVSDSMLHRQRRASADASRVLCCGADLDLSLMMADGDSKGCADPAFEAHVGVLHMWALAVWEDWTPRPLLKWLIDDARGRLDRAKSPWAVVDGPAAAVVATARRLGWSVDSPFEWKS